MKKIFWILVLQAGILIPAFGQFTTPDKITVNNLKGKILLVETQEEVTRTLMDLRPRPEALQAYKDGVANFNQIIKDAVEKYYQWGKKGIEYMPALQVEKLVKEGKAGKYVILHFTVAGSYVNPADIGPIYGGKYTDSVRALSRSKGYGIFIIQLPGGNDKKMTDVYSVGLPVAYPSAADMVYAIQMIHNVFTDLTKLKDYEVKDFHNDIEKNNRKLKKKTLLIENGQVTAKTTLADLKKDYDYPMQIVSYEKIQDAILQSDSSYAYVQVVPIKTSASSSGNLKLALRHLVVDAKDGRVLGTAKPSRMNYDKIASDITKKEVKDYIQE